MFQVFVFIVFMIFRVGDGGNIFYWGLGPLPPTTTAATPTTTTATTTTTTTTTEGYNQNCKYLTIYIFIILISVIFSAFERNIFLEKLLHSKAAAEDKESFKSSDCVLNERDENDLVFGIMTTVGYWFITIVLMIGLLLGDRPKMTVINNIYLFEKLCFPPTFRFSYSIFLVFYFSYQLVLNK